MLFNAFPFLAKSVFAVTAGAGSTQPVNVDTNLNSASTAPDRITRLFQRKPVEQETKAKDLIAEAGAPTLPEQSRLVEVPRDEFSPHYLVRRGSPTGELVPLPGTSRVETITAHNGKAILKLRDDSDTEYWLDPLGINPSYAGESPLKECSDG